MAGVVLARPLLAAASKIFRARALIAPCSPSERCFRPLNDSMSSIPRIGFYPLNFVTVVFTEINLLRVSFIYHFRGDTNLCSDTFTDRYKLAAVLALWSHSYYLLSLI